MWIHSHASHSDLSLGNTLNFYHSAPLSSLLRSVAINRNNQGYQVFIRATNTLNFYHLTTFLFKAGFPNPGAAQMYQFNSNDVPTLIYLLNVLVAFQPDFAKSATMLCHGLGDAAAPLSLIKAPSPTLVEQSISTNASEAIDSTDRCQSIDELLGPSLFDKELAETRARANAIFAQPGLKIAELVCVSPVPLELPAAPILWDKAHTTGTDIRATRHADLTSPTPVKTAGELRTYPTLYSGKYHY